jgi:hypothetical protein
VSPNTQAAVIQQQRRWPGLSEQEALADLWSHGIKDNDTYRGYYERMANAEDDDHNVFKHPSQFNGWHVAICELYKPKVYRFEISRWLNNGAEKRIGYCNQDILRVAIEQRLCTKPNGFMLP